MKTRRVLTVTQNVLSRSWLGVLHLLLVVDAWLAPRQNTLFAVKAFNKALDPGALQVLA